MAKKTTVQFLSITLLLILSMLSFYFSWDCSIPFICVLLIDVYVAFLLIMAAGKTDINKKWFKNELWLEIFPTRVFGLAMFAIFLFVFIYSFASIYLMHGNEFEPAIKSPNESFYISFQILTTLGEGTTAPISSIMRNTLIFEVLSTLNLLLGGFALLVSRLSNF